MLDYNTIFFAECQDGNGFLFHFINFAQTYVIFYSRLTSRNIPFLCFICAVVFNRDHCGESSAPPRNPSPSQKAVKNCCPIYKKTPRTPPQREKSSTVFVYRVCCGLQAFLCAITFCPHQRYFRMVGTRTLILIGFATWSFIPASNAACLSSAKAFAVIAMIGMFALGESAILRIFFAAS